MKAMPTFWTHIDEKLRASFSAQADQYDILASLHREIGRELVTQTLKRTDAKHILDIGTGTGYVAHKAKSLYTQAHVFAVDFAQGMLQKAKEKYDDIICVGGDARALPFKDKSCDLVVSNLAYQWVSPLRLGLSEVKRVLVKDGYFMMTVFGQMTCHELKVSLESAGLSLKRTLPSCEEIEKAMQEAGFIDCHFDQERILIQFNDLLDLMQWLKDIGANHLDENIFLGKERFKMASAYYKKHFPYHAGVQATFEVIWVSGRAK